MAMPTNNPNEIQVVVSMVDKMSAEMTAMRQHVEKQLNATASAGKKVAQEQGIYAKKFNESMRNLATFAVSTGGIMLIGRQLAAGLKDAGLETDKVAESFKKIRANAAGPLVDDVQHLFDIIVDNTDTISMWAQKFTSSIIGGFKIASSSIMSMGASVVGIWDKKWAQQLRADAQAEFDSAILDITANVKLVTPKATPKPTSGGGGGKAGGGAAATGIASLVGGMGLEDAESQASEFYASVIASHGGYVDAWYQTIPAMESVSAWMNKATADTEQAFEASITSLNELFASGAISDQQFVELSMKLSSERIKIAQDENAQLAILRAQDAENAKKLSEMHQDYFWQTATTFGATLVNMGQAARANAEDMKALRIAAALIDGAAAIAGVWRVAMNVSTPYEAAGWAVALTALSAANTAAQVAMISSQSFAMGGNAREGWATVGEHGPEKVYFGQDARVFDANATRTMQLGNSGGTTITFNIQPGATVDNTSVQTIERLLIRADREGRLESFKARMR
jgi:hypothetical protein